MHSYQHHIKDFNNATRHLTRVERSLYRDAIELYYETEQPLPADDFDRLARRLLAFSDEEKTALQFVLDEFFERTGDVYSHDRCDEEIEKYRDAKTAKSAAGKASAEARRKKAEARKQARKQHKGTGVEQPLDSDETEHQQNPTNQEPETNNQYKPSSSEAGASDGDGTGIDPPPEKPAPEKFSDDDYRLAEGMAKAVQRVAPKVKPPDLAKWADTIRLMRERDSLSHPEIAAVFRFANGDEFWKVNILSPAKLREKFATLDAKMRASTDEKRNGTAAGKWAIDHDDTSWNTGVPGPGDDGVGQHDLPPNADNLYRLETGRGG